MEGAIEKLGITDREMSDVIETFNIWKVADAEFCGMWYGYDQFSDCTNIDIWFLKKIIQELKNRGIVEYMNLFDHDGMVAGSGYILHDSYVGKTWEEIKEL